MIFTKIFKLPRYKRFEYAPRYYDPQKEELEERLKAIKEAQNPKGEGVKYRLEKHFEKIRNTSSFRKQRQQSNLRMAVIIFMLGILVYILLH